MNKKYLILLYVPVLAISMTGCGSKKADKKLGMAQYVDLQEIEPNISEQEYDSGNISSYFDNVLTYEEFGTYFNEVELNRDNWSDYYELEQSGPGYILHPKNNNYISSKDNPVEFSIGYSVQTSSDLVKRVRDDVRSGDELDDLYSPEDFIVYDARGTMYEENIPDSVWKEKNNADGMTIRYIDVTDGLTSTRLYENGFILNRNLFDPGDYWDSDKLKDSEKKGGDKEAFYDSLADFDIHKFKNTSVEERVSAERDKNLLLTSPIFIPEEEFINSISRVDITEDNYDEYVEEYVEDIDGSAVVSVEIKDGFFLPDDPVYVNVYYYDEYNGESGFSNMGQEEIEYSMEFVNEGQNISQVKCKQRLGEGISSSENRHIKITDIETSISEVYSMNIPEEYINRDYISKFEYGYEREFIVLGDEESSYILYLDDWDNIRRIIEDYEEGISVKERFNDENKSSSGEFELKLESNNEMTYFLFRSYTGGTDIPKLEELGIANDLKNAKSGETFIFGQYEQDGIVGNGKEPIEWIVCDKKDGYALLLSRYLLDKVDLFSEYQGIDIENRTWDKSLTRLFLNEYFYNVAFSEEEKQQIMTTTHDASDSDAYMKKYEQTDAKFLGREVETSDRVFELSASEWLILSSKDSDRFITYPTAHAYNEDKDYTEPENYYDEFALRTYAGIEQDDEKSKLISYVGILSRNYPESGGSITEKNYKKEYLRPAIWVKY